jgi:hypothetical protein
VKRVIARALAAIGLVPARRYHEVSRRALELTRARDDWKKRATKLARRERTLEQQTRDLERQLKKQARRQMSPPTPPTEARVTTDVPRGDLTALQARLADTERALTLARDQLNAIEVKLEILEGAANVLDARTRVALQRQPDETGAAVS